METIVTCATCEQVLTGGRCTNELCPGYVPREENEATAECGCEVIPNADEICSGGVSYEIIYCPMHAAAADTAKERDEAWEKYAVAANALADCKVALEAFMEATPSHLEAFAARKLTAPLIAAARGGAS